MARSSSPASHRQVATVARWSSTGILETGFNSNTGYAIHDIGSNGAAEYTDGAIIGEDGRLYVAVTRMDSSWTASVLKLASTTLPDYLDGTNEWGPTAAAFFGACLRSIASGATTDAGTWTPGSCASDDTGAWNPVTIATTTITKSPVADPDAVANLRFGMRALSGQAPGYVAPITFEVVAATV